MHQATLKTLSKDSESVSKSLDVDNGENEQVRIITNWKKGEVISQVETNSTRTL